MLKVYGEDEVPHEFDSRQHWPGLISSVQDQKNCAASWAFSTASVATDRLRIHSNGAYKDVTLSPQQLISCHGDHGHDGCSSGHTDRAWWFMRKIGLVSEGCYPSEEHPVGPSNYHYNNDVTAECLMPRTYQALKEAQCPNQGIKTTVYQASPPYKIAPNEREIMNEIMENGPVQAIMEVKEDFYMYESGVYQYSLPAEYDTSEHRKDKHHSVRILGWGVDHTTTKPLKYWLCANSWGTAWGENGHFRILRGADESSIESAVVGVWLKVNDRVLVQRQKSAWNDRKKKHQKEGYWRDEQTNK
jgi:C1A family cysteine protease